MLKKYKYLYELKARTTPGLANGIAQKFIHTLFGDGSRLESELTLESISDLELSALNQWSQRILLLANHCDPNTKKNAFDHMDIDDRESYCLAGNEYDRFLWMCGNTPKLFSDVSKSLSTAAFYDDRSDLACSMYLAPYDVSTESSDGNMCGLQSALAALLSDKDVTICRKLFSTNSHGQGASIHDISVSYNKPIGPHEVSEVKSTESKRTEGSTTLHIVFHEYQRVIEVYSSKTVDRDSVAKIFAKTGLGTHGPISKLFFSYQKLVKPIDLPVIGSSDGTAEVTSIEYCDRKGRSIDHRRELGKNDVGKALNRKGKLKSKRLLTRACITIKEAQTRFPVQVTRIEFRGSDDVRILAPSPRYRWRCHTLLSQWGLVSGARAW